MVQLIELQVLNKILNTKSMQMVIFNGWDESYFSTYKSEFNFLKNHFDSYKTVPDKQTFVDHFPKFNFFLVEEADDYLIDKLQENFIFENAVKQINPVLEMISKKDIDKGIDRLSAVANDLSKLRRTDKCIDLVRDANMRFEEYLRRTRDLNKYYIPTGFPELDKLMGGWDTKEDFVALSGRPGAGKSWVLFNTVLAAAKKGLNVGLYSGEMSENNVGYRMDTLMYHLSNWAISHGDINIQVDYEKAIKSISNDIKGSIKILTPKMIGGAATVSKLRAFVEKEDIQALYIDQYSLLRDERLAKDRTVAFENVSRDLKDLQALKQIAIVTAAQLNRGAVKDKNKDEFAGLENLAGSDRLGQDASIVVGIEQKDKLLTLHLIKNRFGQDGGRISYIWDINKGIFQYSPTERDPLKGEGSDDIKEMYSDSVGGYENNF